MHVSLLHPILDQAGVFKQVSLRTAVYFFHPVVSISIIMILMANLSIRTVIYLLQDLQTSGLRLESKIQSLLY